MPEGPEVKLFVDKLNLNYKNKVIKEVNVLSGRYLKKEIEGLDLLKDQTVDSFSCKGKFIYFNLNSDLVIFNTLGMTGSWSPRKSKHSRLEILFKSGEELYFNDIRNFGTFNIKNSKELGKKLQSLGPDMLSSPPDNFITILRKHDNKNICKVLMDQSIISGVGNYIKAESLWLSNINPHAFVKSLTDKNLVTLKNAIYLIMQTSYKNNGATIQSYYSFDGQKGTQSERFYVYGRKIDHYNNSVLKEETPDKRKTHWSPEKQLIGV